MTQREITLVEYPPLISEAKLIRERGWTDGLIRRYLGPPDALAVNPVRGDRHMKVWWLRRVERVERRDEVVSAFQRISEGRRLRSMIADGSIEALGQHLADDLEAVDIRVLSMPVDELRSRALAFYVALRAERDEPPPDCVDEELMARVMLRYARTHLVDKIALAEAFEHRAKPFEVEYLLRERIKAAIIEAYPFLAPLAAEST